MTELNNFSEAIVTMVTMAQGNGTIAAAQDEPSIDMLIANGLIRLTGHQTVANMELNVFALTDEGLRLSGAITEA